MNPGPQQDLIAIEQGSIEGVVERIVFESDESGFLVGRLRRAGEPDLTTFVGKMLAVSPGETVRLWGRWIDDKKFGRQFECERYQTLLPTSAEAIEKYLGSGLMRGIGPKFAKRLVQVFGVETLRVIDEEPERLRKVAGIGKQRAARIRESWERQKGLQSIMLFLQGHDVSLSQAVRIYKRYGDKAASVLRENPYRLCEEVTGFAFKTTDAIAASMGVPKDSPYRLQAALLYILRQASGNGHVFMPKDEVLTQTAALLETEAAQLEGPLAALTKTKGIILERDALFSPFMYEAETGCAARLKRLWAAKDDAPAIDAARAIAWVEKLHQIQLSEEQREAIRVAAVSKAFVITGGPGTGKTTVLNSLLSIFEKKNMSIRLAAPTGRAAKRMEQATDRPSSTIHRLLEYSPQKNGFTRNENNPLEGDLFVIDECSMVDLPLMYALLRAIPERARLILVGDVDQLPSVGPGNVLMDIIASQFLPVVWLKTVFRQASESGIVANAHLINRGQPPRFNTHDFFFIERKEPERALETVLELVTARMPRKFGLDPLRDIQVLSPMHKGAVGVSRLNEALQAALNPEGKPAPRGGIRTGDKVMQLRNNYELDVYNGDVGILTRIDETAQEARVEFDDGRVVLYDFDTLDELTPAYAATIHKSQGSEYPAVVIPILPQHFVMLQRNVLYTAITRASRLVILVGDPRAVHRAVRNTEQTRRNTRLAERLRNEL